MEKRAYFITGDVLACLLAGAASGWLTQFFVPGDWIAPLAVILGMVLGMTTGMISGLLFSPFFGIHELMLPASLGGMVAGMAVGMAHFSSHVGAMDAVWIGGGAGLAALVFTYVLQARLHGDVR